MPSSPMVEIDCRAVAFTLGLAWKAMPRPAILSIAFHAKPKVKATASQSISTIGLDGILYFLGLKDSWIE